MVSLSRAYQYSMIEVIEGPPSLRRAELEGTVHVHTKICQVVAIPDQSGPFSSIFWVRNGTDYGMDTSS